jgi:glycerol-3-phosphate dehydrogenase (NAD(P)+)
MANGNEVNLVGTHLDRDIINECIKTGRHPKFKREFPKGVNYLQIEDVERAIEDSDFIICGVSSFGVDWFGKEMLPKIPVEIPVLSVTKGLVCLDDGRLICYPEYWAGFDGGKHEICAIGGPCTSYELVAEDQTVVSFCGKNMQTLCMMKDAMATDYYHVNVTDDVMGIESAVALKNGYALGVAFSIGACKRIYGEESELHFNSQAGLFLQASREMTRLIEFLGGGREATYVGIGDLYVTIYGGRTRLLGILLGKGLTVEQALEELSGVTLESTVVAGRVARAIRIMAEKGRLNAQDFPLLFHVDDVLSGKSPVDIPWERFV